MKIVIQRMGRRSEFCHTDPKLCQQTRQDPSQNDQTQDSKNTEFIQLHQIAGFQWISRCTEKDQWKAASYKNGKAQRSYFLKQKVSGSMGVETNGIWPFWAELYKLNQWSKLALQPRQVGEDRKGRKGTKTTNSVHGSLPTTRSTVRSI